MSDRVQLALADTVQVTRADQHIALRLVVLPDELVNYDPTQPLEVLAILPTPRDANNLRDGLGRAIRDTQEEEFDDNRRTAAQRGGRPAPPDGAGGV